MNPFLIEGDILYVDSDDKQCTPGDIVLLRNTLNNDFVAHRLLFDKCSKGDSSLSLDCEDGHCIIGKVIYIKREKTIYLFSKSVGRIISLFSNEYQLKAPQVLRFLIRLFYWFISLFYLKASEYHTLEQE